MEEERKEEEEYSNSMVVVIIGSTGSGKSNLAVELACQLNGEVINADAMQLYKGLDIATNKITVSESKGVEHHLLGTLDITETQFNATKYAVAAEMNTDGRTIRDIQRRGKLPIVVGGTHYYIEELLLHPGDTNDVDVDSKPTDIDMDALLQQDNLYETLQAIDPMLADKLHPNDTRKLQRSLQIYYSTGRKPSEYLIERNRAKRLRYDPCVLWIDCESSLLAHRLQDRVDQMIQRGLIRELETTKEEADLLGINAEEFTHGVFQSIGYKEFKAFFDLPKSQRESQQGKVVFSECTELLKRRTATYAKKQLTWIRNHFLPQFPVYRLHLSDLKLWDTEVKLPAVDIVKGHLQRKPLTEFITMPEGNPAEGLGNWTKYKCDVCDGRILNGKREWEVHLTSKAHKALKRKRNKETKS